MTTEILTNYTVTRDTMAILAAAHMDYHSIVLEPEKKFYVKKTPLQLIKQACLDGYSTYDGRRIAMMYKTSSRKKVPIPINPESQIFAFPTMSPSQFECNWIFHNHVYCIQPTTQSLSQSIITFKNKEQLALKESYYTIEQQMYRTAICMLAFCQQKQTS